MAEHSHPASARPSAILRRNGQVLVTAAAIAFAGLTTIGVLPPPPALAAERMRVVRSRILGESVASVPMRALRRWVGLCLALPATGMTPSSRSDTPALPTVGRPRDGPRR
ncbi:MAG: hypothetical protein WB771_14040 [Solirubrobacterales bacterium]